MLNRFNRLNELDLRKCGNGGEFCYSKNSVDSADVQIVSTNIPPPSLWGNDFKIDISTHKIENQFWNTRGNITEDK